MRYRRRPYEIDAVKWTGENTEEVYGFLGGKEKVEKNAPITLHDTDGSFLSFAYPGCYIIKDFDGYGNEICYAMNAYAFTCEYEPTNNQDNETMRL